jgi:hypothetical protein
VYGVTATKKGDPKSHPLTLGNAPHRHTYIGCDSGHRLPYSPLAGPSM